MMMKIRKMVVTVVIKDGDDDSGDIDEEEDEVDGNEDEDYGGKR